MPQLMNEIDYSWARLTKAAHPGAMEVPVRSRDIHILLSYTSQLAQAHNNLLQAVKDHNEKSIT